MKFRLIKPKYYPPDEEKVNILTHALAAVLSGIATWALLSAVIATSNSFDILSLTIFGVSLTLTYTLSALFHAAIDIRKRAILNIMDRSSIYLLVAGTTTPFTTIGVNEDNGYILFSIVWVIAIIGIIIKISSLQVYVIWSTIVYVLFGWISILGIIMLLPPYQSTIAYLLISGNIAYTVGAVFFTLDRIPYNHAIFHVLAMMGSFIHFLAVYRFVLPQL